MHGGRPALCTSTNTLLDVGLARRQTSDASDSPEGLHALAVHRKQQVGPGPQRRAWLIAVSKRLPGGHCFSAANACYNRSSTGTSSCVVSTRRLVVVNELRQPVNVVTDSSGDKCFRILGSTTSSSHQILSAWLSHLQQLDDVLHGGGHRGVKLRQNFAAKVTSKVSRARWCSSSCGTRHAACRSSFTHTSLPALAVRQHTRVVSLLLAADFLKVDLRRHFVL